jgi:membrane protease YdiL (CAAX protease family)
VSGCDHDARSAADEHDAPSDEGDSGQDDDGSDELSSHEDEHDDEHDPIAASSLRTDPIDELPGGALTLTLVATALTALAQHLAFRPESSATRTALAPLAAIYAVGAVVAVARARARREAWLLRPRAGDLSVGAVVAFLLYGLGLSVALLACSSDSPRHAWILRVYLALGDPQSDAHHLVGLAAATVGLLEELTWRGLVTPALERRFALHPSLGARAPRLLAAVAGTSCFALAHLPTSVALADPIAGPNPLLVAAAFGCGLVWSYLRVRSVRLVPVLLSHALFTWLVVEFPLFALAR